MKRERPPFDPDALNASIEQAIAEGRYSRRKENDICSQCRNWCERYHVAEGGGVLCKKCFEGGGMHNKYAALPTPPQKGER